ncbi:MAG: tandem-95 repeat protein, partial [Actinomycetota bacterium]
MTATTTSLFSVQPAVNAAGDLTFTPAPNAFGSTSVSVTAVDEFGAASAAQTFTITITGVNDAPSFTKGANQTVAEDVGARTVASWATSISAGPGEIGSVSFEISTSNDALFSVLPAVSSAGTLTYTPAANANGSATVSVTARDAEGLTSDTETFTITVTAVNDVPSFTKGANVTVLEDAVAQTVAGWATGISSGPSDESAQTVSFTVTATTTSLFSVQPAVNAAGDLTFTPAPNANGSTSVSVTAVDSAGASSAAQTFTLAITAVNDPPSFTGVATVTVTEDSGSYAAAWASSIAPGPADESGTVTFATSGYDATLFSSVPAIATNGRLTFTPAANKFGSTSVTVTASDPGGATAVQTFSITITAVNDLPSFTKGANVTVFEDSATSTVTNWATAISPGPEEGTQTVTFTVTATTTSLFSVQPAVNAAGDLTFTPAPNANGSTSVSVTAVDSAGA